MMLSGLHHLMSNSHTTDHLENVMLQIAGDGLRMRAHWTSEVDFALEVSVIICSLRTDKRIFF